MFMTRLTYNRRPLLIALASLVAIIFLITLTSPVSNLLVGLIFFGLGLILLINIGFLLLSIGGRTPQRRTKINLIVICTFMVLAAMFMSVQSFNWASGITLALLACGMLFYTSRRS